MQQRGPVLPVEELLHPLPLFAVVVLALNDHFLKRSGLLPGWLTGKLSDVAGLFFFPLLMTALIRTAFILFGRRQPLTPKLLGGAILVTAAIFAALQLLDPVIYYYEWLMPRLDPTGRVRTVLVTPDPTDLLALPTLGLTWLHGRRFFHRTGGR